MHSVPSHRETNNPEPLGMTDMPAGPWQKVHFDFYGPLPSGEYLLACIDRNSRYPEIEIVRSTKAVSVIPRLDKIFSVHGLPHQTISDNAPRSTVWNLQDIWTLWGYNLAPRHQNGPREMRKSNTLCSLWENKGGQVCTL